MYRPDGSRVPAEIVGFQDRRQAVCLPLAPLEAVPAGALVVGTGAGWSIPVGPVCLGRMVDGLGMAVDDGPPLRGPRAAVRQTPLSPLQRRPIDTPFWTGIRVVDTVATWGIGQRMGIYAGAGVGKTTLLQQILAQADFDCAVVALIGERGREAAEFWAGLTPQARQRLTVWVATADQPPLLRLRTLEHATRCAEAWRDAGRHVLLLVDSLTRAAHAAREVGLAAGEPPTARGYPPSLYARMPQWFERAGRTATGAITACYTVLLDGDDPEDPVADAAHSLLDGALYLDRRRAERQQFPALDPLRSISRLQPDLIPREQWALVGQLRDALGRAQDAQDLVAVGAYRPGADPGLDHALALSGAYTTWAQQASDEWVDPAAGWETLAALCAAS